MAKVTAPLIGFSARGQLGKTIVFADWRGIRYAREYVIPANPNSLAQQNVRNVFTNLSRIYALFGPLARASFDAFIAGKPLTSRNRFAQVNVPILDGIANFLGIQTLSAFAGLALLRTAVSVGGVGIITVTTTTATAPTGWTITQGESQAIEDQGDPGTLFAWDPNQVGEDADVAAPPVPIIAGLQAGTYRVTTVLRLLAPDGTIRYSNIITGSATVP